MSQQIKPYEMKDMDLIDPGDSSKLELISMTPFIFAIGCITGASIAIASSIYGIDKIIKKPKKLFHTEKYRKINDEDILNLYH